MNIGINDRLIVENNICTILYIGRIPNWPNNIAYGVEWDREDRGRHDGMVDGVRYYSTKNPGAGSFLKDYKIQQAIESRTSFEKALQSKYGDSSTEAISIEFGEKRTESYGFIELNRRNCDLSGLKIISLPKCHIYCAELSPGLLSQILGKEQLHLKNLDLSFNLFTDLEEVLTIIGHFPLLRCLNLSGNRFFEFRKRSGTLVYPKVKELSLSCCRINKDVLQEFLQFFPNLEVLDISSNGLKDLPVLPTGLKELSIADNMFQYVPDVSGLSYLSSFDISNNQISSLPLTTCFAPLKHVMLHGNRLQSWNSVDKVNKLFPKIEHLWIKENPFCEETNQEYFYQVIARISLLNSLDGTPINAAMRKEAELFFISMVLSSNINFDLDSFRWNELKSKHKIKDFRKDQKNGNFLENQLLSLPVIYQGHKYHINILTSFTVRYLRTILREKFQTDNIFMRYSIINGIENEFTHEFSSLDSFNIKESVIYVSTS